MKKYFMGMRWGNLLEMEQEMRASEKRRVTLATYLQVQKLPIAPRQREVALGALRTAEAIADTIVWGYRGLQQLFGVAVAKPARVHTRRIEA